MDYYADPRLSQSKIKAYVKCPHLYYKLFIEKSYDPPKTKEMTIGSALDCVLTTSQSLADSGLRLTPALLRDVERMRLKVTQQPVMASIAWMSTQTELFTEKHKGKLDYFGIKGSTAWIGDLKSCQDTAKFLYVFDELGYDLQMAFYKMLVKANHPQVRRFRYFFVAVDKTKQTKFEFFEVSNRRINAAERRLKRIIQAIEQGKRLTVGVCRHCPPELNCPYALVTEKEIVKF